jgi:hypothetical protein
MPGIQPLLFDNNPRVEFISEGDSKVIPMYVATDFNQQYDEVRISVFPNETDTDLDIYFRVYALDGTVTTTQPVSVTPGTTYQYNNFASIGQYELILDNQNSNQSQSVSIITTRHNPLPGEPPGLPFVGEQVLRIVADYLGLTRAYEVRIPTP